MPERIFKYQSVAELTGFARALSTAITTGSTQELRNNHTGFLKSTGPLKPADLRQAMRDVRWEIYWRGQNLPDTDGDKAVCLAFEPTNPLHEKVMRVETLHRPPYFLTSPYGA
jgi:hypothetical protein